MSPGLRPPPRWSCATYPKRRGSEQGGSATRLDSRLRGTDERGGNDTRGRTDERDCNDKGCWQDQAGGALCAAKSRRSPKGGGHSRSRVRRRRDPARSQREMTDPVMPDQAQKQTSESSTRPSCWSTLKEPSLPLERKQRISFTVITRDDDLDVVLQHLRHQRLRAHVLPVDEFGGAVGHDVIGKRAAL